MNKKLENDPKPFEIMDSKYLFRKDWLTVREEKLRLASGGVIENFYVFEYPDWVNVIALTSKNEVVLIRQYRHAIGEVYYEIPAGVCEQGENLQEAAKRELLEETGYGGGEWTLFMTLSANPSTQNNKTYTFLARDVSLNGKQALDSTEEITIHLTPLAQIKDLIFNGEFIQSLHTAPLLKLLLSEAS